MDSRATLILVLGSLSATLGCLRDARTCAVATDCFSSEACVSGVCAPGAPQADMTPDQDATLPPGVTQLGSGQIISTERFARGRIQGLTGAGCASALAKDGGVRFLFVDESEATVQPLIHMRWDPAARTWSEEALTAQDLYLTQPDIVLDLEGRAHVCAHEPIENAIFYLKEGAQGWTRERFEIPAVETSRCRIALSQGQPVILYEGPGRAAPGRALQLATRSAQGAWSSAPLDAQAHDFARPAGIWGLPEGGLAVAYMASLAERPVVRVGSRDAPASLWFFEEEAPLYGRLKPDVQAAIDGRGQVHLVLQEEAGDDLVVLRYLDPLSPENDLEVEADLFQERLIGVAAEADGTPHLMFSAGDSRVYATREGSTWSIWAMPESSNLLSQCTRLHVDEQGRAHALYDVEDGENATMVYRVMDVNP